MKKLKLYIETSVWNFLFADDAPDKKQETIKFFDVVQSDEYELFISELVFDEIKDAPEPIRSILLKEIESVSPENLEITNEIQELAALYAQDGFVPQKAFSDLIHLAAATVNNMDFVVSWNLAHIVKIKTKIGIAAVNLKNGYKEIEICTVQEVI